MTDQKVEILGIVGSPRKKGHTGFLIEEALKAARELGGINAEAIYLSDKKIEPCSSCSDSSGLLICGSHKRCIHNDDMTNELYDKLMRADGIIVGSPVYFGSITAQLKAFIDRTCWLKLAKFWALRDKVGGAITVAYGRHGGQEVTLMALYSFFMIQGMIMVTDAVPTKKDYDDYTHITQKSPSSNVSVVEARGHFPAAYGDERYGKVKKDWVGIVNARGLGQHVAQVAKWVKPNRPPVERVDYFKIMLGAYGLDKKK
jgi:multimeric flavodoxin WrbA